MDMTLAATVPYAVLSDVQTFLTSAQHLKALTLQLQERRTRESRLQATLARQIESETKHCTELVAGNPRLTELWRQAQTELRAITTPG